MLSILKMTTYLNFLIIFDKERSDFFTIQPAKEYNFFYTRLLAHKTILSACPCMWEYVPMKEQKWMSLIIT